MALRIFKETLRGKKICYMESICYMTIIYNMIVARFLRNVPSLKRKKQKTDGNEKKLWGFLFLIKVYFLYQGSVKLFVKGQA